MIIVVEMSARSSNRLQSSTHTVRRAATDEILCRNGTAESADGFRQRRVKIIQYALILALYG